MSHIQTCYRFLFHSVLLLQKIPVHLFHIFYTIYKMYTRIKPELIHTYFGTVHIHTERYMGIDTYIQGNTGVLIHTEIKGTGTCIL